MWCLAIPRAPWKDNSVGTGASPSVLPPWVQRNRSGPPKLQEGGEGIGTVGSASFARCAPRNDDKLVSRKPAAQASGCLASGEVFTLRSGQHVPRVSRPLLAKKKKKRN